MRRIEDYGLIGDCETAALVGRDGSIDWLCWPRFDSDACFAALLGDPDNGRWLIAPAADTTGSSRRYLDDTLALETTFETADGVVTVTDFMPPRGKASDVVRLVRGQKGCVAMRMQLILRFGYGAYVPWVTRHGEVLRAIAGPDMVVLRTSAPIRGEDLTTVAEFNVNEGETVPFVLTYGPSHERLPDRIDPEAALDETQRFWRDWISASQLSGPYRDTCRRSLITLKALTHAPTGGLVAAPTTSLPEAFGGERNWDYRFCWIRDATLTLRVLTDAGHTEEARDWANWLHRAVAGDPGEMQIMYGVGGERRLTEWEVDWLAGFEGSRPVRIGNAAHTQFQLDVYGELMDAFHRARVAGFWVKDTWAVELKVIEHVRQVWREPDEGLWEVRSEPQHFTFSKAAAWVVLDRAIRAVDEFGCHGPVDAWRAEAEIIRRDILAKGRERGTGAFRRAYDDPTADASLLLLAEIGFVAWDDPSFIATVAKVERELMDENGLVRRYDTHRSDDGLPPGEGAFLPCSFWLASAYAQLGRLEEAQRLFERLAGLANDLGLLSEEYDAKGRRLAGNFPQAFTHVALLGAGLTLGAVETAADRSALAR